MAENKNPFFGATFAERKAIREGKATAEPKQVDAEAEAVEDKAVKKAPAKRAAKKA